MKTFLYICEMKKRFIWGCFILFSNAAHAKTLLGQSTQITDRKKMPIQNLFEDNEDRFYRSWDTYLEVCWKNNRATACENSHTSPGRQRLDFKCSQSLSANCPDASCEILGLKGIDDVTILKGEYRDFLVVRGSQNGCGGTSYNINLIDDQSKIRCSYAHGVSISGENDDAAAEKVLRHLYKEPLKFIRWVGEKCEFRLSKKELSILKKKQ
jgi:hypothetical protein